MIRPAWADTPCSDKRRVQALIPEKIHSDLFVNTLPTYGTASTVLTHLLASFHAKLKRRIRPGMTLKERELIAQEILTKL